MQWNFPIVILFLTTGPQFSLIDESPGQKELHKQNAVLIVKNAWIGRIDGLKLVPSIHIQMLIHGPVDPDKHSILIQSTVGTIGWGINIEKYSE